MLASSSPKKFVQHIPWIIVWLLCFESLQISGATRFLQDLSFDAHTPCRQDVECQSLSLDRFCFKKAATRNVRRQDGVCTSCWKCCLFPEVYGACPAGCACGGNDCYQTSDCGQGTYCAADGSVCKVCQVCYASNAKVIGNQPCDDFCPYSFNFKAVVQDGESVQTAFNLSSYSSSASWLPTFKFSGVSLDTYAFVVLSAQDIFGWDTPGILTPEDFSTWAEAQGLAGSAAQRNWLFAHFDFSPQDGIVTETEWILAILSHPFPISLMCPDEAQMVLEKMNETFPGCPCIPQKNSPWGRCPEGYYCSVKAYDVFSAKPITALAVASDTGAMCTPCVAGQYCAPGTYQEDESELSALNCPSGMYCPTPDVKLDCPAGFFCPVATTTPTTCDVEKALSRQSSNYMYTQEEYMIVQVYSGKQALKGNFCPVGSSKPSMLCPKGQYCPNPAKNLTCPSGHYCPAQTVVAKKCGVLEGCQAAGVGSREYSALAFINTGVVIAGALLLWLCFIITQNELEPIWNSLDEEYAGQSMDGFRKLWMKLWHMSKVLLSMDVLQVVKADPFVKALVTWIERKRLQTQQGSTHFTSTGRYQAFSDLQKMTVRFYFKDMRICGTTRNVLTNVKGEFKAGTLNAILGPSGCGKTTLLKTLCNQVTAQDGVYSGRWTIWYNDVSLTVLPPHHLPKIIGFVPQDDIVHEDLTVRENLVYASSLKLDPRTPSRIRSKLIEDALSMLSIMKRKDTLVGSVEHKTISGGERKRVNIGLELVGKPSILFLDEPTSGLDATNSLTVLWGLQALAKVGMNIVTIIHQPRSFIFHLFDKVLMLGDQGHTVYIGHPMMASCYFDCLGFVNQQSENPADFYLDIISGRAEMADEVSYVIEKHHLPMIWEHEGRKWMKMMEESNRALLCRRPALKEITPEILESLKNAFDEYGDEDDYFLFNRNDIRLILTGYLGIEVTDEDVNNLLACMGRGGVPSLSKKELAKAMVAPPIEQMKLDEFKKEVCLFEMDTRVIKAITKEVVMNDTDKQKGFDIVGRLGSLISRVGTLAANSFSATHKGKTLPAHMLKELQGLSPRSNGTSPAGTPRMRTPDASFTMAGSTMARAHQVLMDHQGQRSHQSPLEKTAGVPNAHSSLSFHPSNQGSFTRAGHHPMTTTEQLRTQAASRMALSWNEAKFRAVSAGLSSSPLARHASMAMPRVRRSLSADQLSKLLHDSQEEDTKDTSRRHPAIRRSRSAHHLPSEQRTAPGTTCSISAKTLGTTAAARACNDNPKSLNAPAALASHAIFSQPASPGWEQPQTLHPARQPPMLDRLMKSSSSQNGMTRVADVSASKEAPDEGVNRQVGRTTTPTPTPAFIKPQNTTPHSPSASVTITAARRAAELLRQISSVTSSSQGDPSSDTASFRTTAHLDSRLSAEAISIALGDDDDQPFSWVADPLDREQSMKPTSRESISPRPQPLAHQKLAPDDSNASEQLQELSVATSSAQQGDVETERVEGLQPQDSLSGKGRVGNARSQTRPRDAAAAAYNKLFGGRRCTGEAQDGQAKGKRVSLDKGQEGGAGIFSGHRFSLVAGMRQAAGGEELGAAGDSRGLVKRFTMINSRTRRSLSHEEMTQEEGMAQEMADEMMEDEKHVNMVSKARRETIIAKRNSVSGVNIPTSPQRTSSFHPTVGEQVSPRLVSIIQCQLALDVAAAAVAAADAVLEEDSKQGRTGWRPTTEARSAYIKRKAVLMELLDRYHMPGLWMQFRILVSRTMLKQRRTWPYPIMDIILLLAIAYIIGFIHGTDWRLGRFPNNVVMAMTALGVLSCTIHIRTFDQNSALFRREVTSGMSIAAYFYASIVVDMFWVVVAPAVFLSAYYYLTLPSTSFSMFYVASLGVTWWASGMAYTVSACLPRMQTMVATVFMTLVMGAFINGLDPSLKSAKGTIMEAIMGLSYTRWSMEALSILELSHHVDTMRNTIISLLSYTGICDSLIDIKEPNNLTVQEAILLSNLQTDFQGVYEKCFRVQRTAFIVLFAEGTFLRLLALMFLQVHPVTMLLQMAQGMAWVLNLIFCSYWRRGKDRDKSSCLSDPPSIPPTAPKSVARMDSVMTIQSGTIPASMSMPQCRPQNN